MTSKATFTILGIAAVLVLVVATTLSSSAYAALTTSCSAPGKVRLAAIPELLKT
jgi:hypothetical protein